MKAMCKHWGCQEPGKWPCTCSAHCVSERPRHRWGDPSRPSNLRTTRVCTRCGLVRVTRHDGGLGAIPWTEFYEPSGLLVEVASGRTPACEPVEAGVA
jgi:hypothetical protein